MRSRFTAVALAVTTCLAIAAPAASAQAPLAVHIAGNSFVNAAGKPLRLLGVTGPDASAPCVQPRNWNQGSSDGFFAGPTDAGAISAMTAWKINTVRIALNEDCWLGDPPLRQGEGKTFPGTRAQGRAYAARYQAAVVGYVARLHAAGLYVILDLHWSAPKHTLAWAQWAMADADHSPAFWRSVATVFHDDPGALFEIFNEPIGRPGVPLTWNCLREGCRLPNICGDCAPNAKGPPGCFACPNGKKTRKTKTYAVAGTQSLVNVIRATGATQPILSPGLHYSNDLSQWLAFKPADPLNQIGATFHTYSTDKAVADPSSSDPSSCDTPTCWDSQLAPVAAQVPISTTEFGQFDCGVSYENQYMAWADAHGVSYFGFPWQVNEQGFACGDGYPQLISDNNGTPRAAGVAFHDHLAALPPSG